MATSGQNDKFIRKLLFKGITQFEEQVRRSNLPTSNPQYSQGSGWRRLERAKDKALKKKNWFMDKRTTGGQSNN